MPELGKSGSAGGPGWVTSQVYPTDAALVPDAWHLQGDRQTCSRSPSSALGSRLMVRTLKAGIARLGSRSSPAAIVDPASTLEVRHDGQGPCHSQNHRPSHWLLHEMQNHA
jgi:hypothetical protein